MDKFKKRKRNPVKISEKYLHNAGLAYLQRFSASENRFREVMTRKIDRSCAVHTDQNRDECLAMLDGITARFRRSGLLNDEDYAQAQIVSMRRRGLSARAISAKMAVKGIDGALTSRFLNTDEDEEFHAALKMAKKKKLGPFRNPASARTGEKELAALARAGYGYELSNRILSMASEEAEAIFYGTHQV